VEVNTRAIVAYASAETSHVGKLGPLKNGDTVRQRPALFDPPPTMMLACTLDPCMFALLAAPATTDDEWAAPPHNGLRAAPSVQQAWQEPHDSWPTSACMTPLSRPCQTRCMIVHSQNGRKQNKHGSIAFQHCVRSHKFVGLHTSDMHGQPDTSLAPFKLIPSFPRHLELTPGHLISALMCLGLFVRACIHHMAFVH
jgi:hypothetical protein